MQRALILQSGEEILADDIHFEAARVATARVKVEKDEQGEVIPDINKVSSDENIESLNGDLKQREWNLILGAIKAAKGSRKMTAEKLGISQRTLRYKLARMRDAGIVVPDSGSQKSSVC